MNLAVVDVVWQWEPRQYSAQRGFYGDVEHCVKDVRRRWPHAFADCETDTPSVKYRWVRDGRFSDSLPPEMREIIGEDQEWCIVWGGRYMTAVAFLVRSHKGAKP